MLFQEVSDMSKKRYATLQGIENNRRICDKQDGEFLLNLKRGLLLALADRGTLTEVQYTQAETELKRQRTP